MTPKTGWKWLNAYIDCELQPKDAAEISRSAAVDPGVADQIDLLRQLKDATREALTQRTPDIVIPQESRRARVVKVALAACAACCMIAGALVLSMQPKVFQRSPDIIEVARDMHEDWIATDNLNATNKPPAILAAISQFGSLPVIPDLESTGLAIGLLSVDRRQDAGLLQIGYRGHHGCHLSLFVLKDKSSLRDIAGTTDRLDRTYGWNVGPIGYLLLARGMDQSRFDLIAKVVESATRSGTPLSPSDKKLLAENRRNAKSCTA